MKTRLKDTVRGSLGLVCLVLVGWVGMACREPPDTAVSPSGIHADGGVPMSAVSVSPLVRLSRAGQVPPVAEPRFVPIDRDADGSPLPYDCDDGNGRAAPGNLELCDGVDNDCNGLVDEDWPVGEPCELQNACRTPGWIDCTDDARHARCMNEDAECWE